LPVEFQQSYTVKIDPFKVGYSLTAIVLIQIEGGHLQDVEDKIANLPNVTAVYDVTGDYNAVVITKFKDGADLNTFIKKLLTIPHVRRTVTNVALSVIKEDFRIKL
jgi:Lrp/AsnC family transcriptional regulator for asnA, asnC and gidA